MTDEETAATLRERLSAEIRERPIQSGGTVGLMVGLVLGNVVRFTAVGVAETQMSCYVIPPEKYVCEPMWPMRLQAAVVIASILAGAAYGYLS